MKFEDLNNYPEYPNTGIVEQLRNLVLDDAEKDLPEATLEALCYLGDKQWHTYRYPSKELRTHIKNWLIQCGILDSDKDLTNVLVVSFDFTRDKEFHKTVSTRYTGKKTMAI